MSVRLWKRLFARLTVWGILGVSALVALLLGNAAWHVWEKQQQAALEYRTQAAALVELQGRKDALHQKLSALDTDRGVEAELRERYSVAKPGEELIVVVEPKKTENPVTYESKTAWESFRDWVSSIF